MNIEIVNIGTEVLRGFTVNTNASFLCSELFKAGFAATQQTTVNDTPEKMREILQEAMGRSDVVITTGGLGPTLDDLTRKTVAELTGAAIVEDAAVKADLIKRFGSDLPSLSDQSLVPDKAKAVLNRVGTAPGLIFEIEGAILIMLPGVPSEMQVMFREEILPFLTRKFSQERQQYLERLHLFELRESDVDPLLRELAETYPGCEFGIYPGLGVLEVQVQSNTSKQEVAECAKRLREELREQLYTSASGTLEEAVQNYFVAHKLTLSTAESCTGGGIAARLTQIPGASDYFLGSVVSYSNEVKQTVLKVPEALLREKGAVSAEVVRQMASEVRKLTGSDCSVAVSGVAGPSGGTAEKPVGTVWCAVCFRDREPVVWKLELRGTRDRIITRSINAILARLLIEGRRDD